MEKYEEKEGGMWGIQQEGRNLTVAAELNLLTIALQETSDRGAPMFGKSF